MQTEREYLTEVSNLLDAIQRTPDERRKEIMKRTLHGRLYERRSLYGFRSIEQVRQSIDYMNAGKFDPSRNQRCLAVKKGIEIQKAILTDMEMTAGRATVPGKDLEPSKEQSKASLSWLKDRDLDKDEPELDDKEIDLDLDLE